LNVEVATAVEAAVEQVLQGLAQIGVRPTTRDEPVGVHGWWE